MTLKLTERQREVMVLKCRDGLTNEDVGAHLGISRFTVKIHVTNALACNPMDTTAEMCWELALEEFEKASRDVSVDLMSVPVTKVHDNWVVWRNAETTTAYDRS